MNFKVTAILLVLLALVGTFAYFYGGPTPIPDQAKPPFVYSIDMENIVGMEVTYRGQKLDLTWNEDQKKWLFTNPSQGEADQGRVNGIRLLLSGPGSKRVLFKGDVSDLSQFGLADPQTVATVELKDGSRHAVLIGDLTPNGENYYIKNRDDQRVFLVDFTWGNEIARFVIQPPVATPTPVPTPPRAN
ncbi:MAG: DUF4340 domain-containing protein [Dehalococcoidia bacterium]|nr:DUF4340 domain-containing protein [Dehalococcoidia bacterium]